MADAHLNLYRGALVNPTGPQTLDYWPDGLLVVNDAGVVVDCGPWNDLNPRYQAVTATMHYFSHGHLMMPGLVDLHVHLPQIKVTGRQKPNLMDWLETHIFPAEMKFMQPEHACKVSQWFFGELLKNGTTTAAVFTTLHTSACQAAFETAEAMGNRVVMGLNLMDQNAPPQLLRETEALLADTEMLCETWHGRDAGRIQYAWMPRFAISCSEKLMMGLGELRQQYPGTYCHSHLSEQQDEVAAVRDMYPKASSYTDVYHQYGLLGPRTLMAHGIYLDDKELALLHRTQTALAHCPSANFFLHSGRFRWFDVNTAGVAVGLGSDVGAGPELNLFKVMKDAQYMQATELKGRVIEPKTLLYHATLGGAKALMQDDVLGNFAPGKQADFVVLNLQCKSGMPDDLAERDIETILSSLVFLGDDRLVTRTYVRGREVYRQGACLTLI